MRAGRCLRVSLVAAGIAFAAQMSLPAVAQTDTSNAPAASPAKKAKKPVAAAKAGQVLVQNNRDATLVELTLTGKTKGAEPVTIASGISPGGKMTGKLPAKAGCVFSVAGTFDDE